MGFVTLIVFKRELHTVSSTHEPFLFVCLFFRKCITFLVNLIMPLLTHMSLSSGFKKVRGFGSAHVLLFVCLFRFPSLVGSS